MNNPYPSAFHDSGTYQGMTFSYAMVPICNSTTIAWTQTGAAHELFEAATDAVPLSDPAYQFGYGSPWQSLFGEVADLCESLPSATVEGFTVPLLWSNAVATKGKGWPCLPAPATPYFGVTAATPKVKMKGGVPKEIAMTAWSSAPLAGWDIAPFTMDVYLAPTPFTPVLDVSPKHVENGDAVTLVVKAAPGTPSGALGLAVVASQAGGLVTMWPVLVEIE